MSKLDSVWMNTHPNYLLGPIILSKESKIYRWYKKLAEVDPELQRDDLAPHLDEYLTRLNHIEAKVCQTSVPLSFSNELYHLRLHIEMLRNKLVPAASNTGSSNDFQ